MINEVKFKEYVITGKYIKAVDLATLIKCKQPKIFLNSVISIGIICLTNRTFYRSSCPEVFCKNGVLSNFAKFTGKHLC